MQMRDGKRYWNRFADNYDGEVFSSLEEDVRGVIRAAVKAVAGAARRGAARAVPVARERTRAADLGCGVGKYLVLLAAHFDHVEAWDLSPKLVERARAAVRRADPALAQRVSRVAVADLARPEFSAAAASEEPFDCAVLANVLISPGEPGLRAVLAAARLRLRPGGHAVVVVPALESALHVKRLAAEAGMPKGAGPYGSPLPGGDALLRGELKRAGVATKHFLEVEFEAFAAHAGFTVVPLSELTEDEPGDGARRGEAAAGPYPRGGTRVVYSWASELDLAEAAVPRHFASQPPPFDWLFVLRRT